MMPTETQAAVSWALKQSITDMYGTKLVSKDTPYLIVDKVREYFNTNKVTYTTFSYDDLKPFFN